MTLQRQVGKGVIMASDYCFAKLCHRFRSLDDREDEEDVTGKIVIVTGANIGLGRTTALQLAKRGCVVVMACRDMAKGQAAYDYIKSEVPKADLHLMRLDLGDLSSVRRFAEEVNKKFDKINILINNAGVMDSSGNRSLTNDAFESHMGINHLGPFLLTNLLLDRIQKGAPSRIVCLGSTLHQLAELNVDDLMLDKSTDYGLLNLIPYNNSKLANILFAKELGKRLKNTGVTTYAVCPGLVKTELFRHDRNCTRVFNNFMMFFGGLNVRQGCETILHCSVSKKCANETGFYYRFGEIWTKAYEKLDDEMAQRLWSSSEEVVQLKSKNPLHSHIIMDEALDLDDDSPEIIITRL